MNIGFDISRSGMKELFFDRPAVAALMDNATRRFLGRAGAYARRVARNAMRPRRVKLKSLSAEARKDLKRRQAIARHYGRPIPKPPRDTSPSRPGQPPRMQTGLLRDNIFFTLEPRNQSVIIGPAKLAGGSDAPATLESGGTITRSDGKRITIAARPYMGPALQKTTERIDQFWS